MNHDSQQGRWQGCARARVWERGCRQSPRCRELSLGAKRAPPAPLLNRLRRPRGRGWAPASLPGLGCGDMQAGWLPGQPPGQLWAPGLTSFPGDTVSPVPSRPAGDVTSSPCVAPRRGLRTPVPHALDLPGDPDPGPLAARPPSPAVAAAASMARLRAPPAPRAPLPPPLRAAPSLRFCVPAPPWPPSPTDPPAASQELPFLCQKSVPLGARRPGDGTGRARLGRVCVSLESACPSVTSEEQTASSS